jgi:hypothetical protein
MIPRPLYVTALGVLLTLPVPARPDGELYPAASVSISQPVLDSMNVIFGESNRNWDKLQDLNTMERMLGTVRPTQKEYLGCLQGTVDAGSVTVNGFLPARNMRQLPLAVTGTCDSLPRVIGAWHTHPYHADPENRPLKSRELSPQDLATFAASSDRVAIVVWDQDSLDAAVKAPDGSIIHPAKVEIR